MLEAADFELPPRAAIKLRAAKNLHDARQRQGKPMKPRLAGEVENPLARHERGGDGDAQPQIELPVLSPGFPAGAACAAGCRRHFPRLETRPFDGFNDGGDVSRRAGIPAHRRRFVVQRNHGAADAGDGLDRFGDMPRAVGAGHAADPQFRHGGILPGVRFHCGWRLHLRASSFYRAPGISSNSVWIRCAGKQPSPRLWMRVSCKHKTATTRRTLNVG